MNFDFRQAVAFLDAHTNLEGKRGSTPTAELPTAGKTDGLTLGPMRELMAALGDPHLAYRTIHVTGTNGKGSVTRFSSAMLAATGLSVGTFTSPNLERLNERIAYNGEMISDDEFARIMSLLASVEPLLESTPGRWDLLSAAALTWFADLGVDVAVVEVGMLGRYDSTNVVESDVAVLTNIGKDHTDGKPGWERQIANEKAGIIKPNSHVVLGRPFEELRSEVDAEESLGVWEAETDFEVVGNSIAFGGRVVDVRTPYGLHEEIFIPVHGEHQGENLATAIAATETFFGKALDTDLIKGALEEIEIPGRFEVVNREPTVILDGGHNPDGVRTARMTLETEFARIGSWILVFGMLTGRDHTEMLEAINAPDFDAVILTQPTWSRSVPAEELAVAAHDLGMDPQVVTDPVEAFQRAKAVAGTDDIILVVGSLYLIGDIRPAARSVLED